MAITDSFLPADETYGSVTREISEIPLHYPTRRNWWIGIAISGALVLVLLGSIGYLLIGGIGIWGVQIPVTWGLAIINYVWWLGMGHAGTLISALLLVMNKGWRNSLNRFAEAMTVFAVICAAMYPILHLGRPFRFYYLIPYPSTLKLWPQFRSPLIWDVFAVGSYLIVSILFWYIGVVPDLATMRDRAKHPFARKFYGVFALGWRGSAIHWARWRMAYWIIAGLAVPLVVSVHSGVGLLFAASIEPGWQTTIFPPFFVLGAVYEGFAVVTLISITLRASFGLYDLVTAKHLDLLAQLVLATGLATGYGYLMEGFSAWYSGDAFERFNAMDRMVGQYGWIYWATLLCNVVVVQALWFRWTRHNVFALFTVAAIVTLGMWFERYMLITTTLYRDFLPSSWQEYVPTVWDWATFAGMIGLFFFLFFLFVRFLPMISMFELKEVMHEEKVEGQDG